MINYKLRIIEINADPSKQSQDELGCKGVESIASALVVESCELDLTLGLGFLSLDLVLISLSMGKEQKKLLLRLFQ